MFGKCGQLTRMIQANVDGGQWTWPKFSLTAVQIVEVQPGGWWNAFFGGALQGEGWIFLTPDEYFLRWSVRSPEGRALSHLTAFTGTDSRGNFAIHLSGNLAQHRASTLPVSQLFADVRRGLPQPAKEWLDGWHRREPSVEDAIRSVFWEETCGLEDLPMTELRDQEGKWRMRVKDRIRSLERQGRRSWLTYSDDDSGQEFDGTDSAIERADLRNAIAALPSRTQEILRAYYEAGRTDLEIGREMGISQQAVNATRNEALKALKKLLS